MMHLEGSVYSLPTLRPCFAIEAEASGGIRVDLEERYAALTHPLALDGSAAMSLSENGDVVLVKALRARFPWMEAAIAVLEQQVRLSKLALIRPQIDRVSVRASSLRMHRPTGESRRASTAETSAADFPDLLSDR